MSQQPLDEDAAPPGDLTSRPRTHPISPTSEDGGTPAAIRAIERAASAYETVSLAELGSASLMDRIDTKFLVPATAVPGLLDRCREHYRLLEVNGTVLARYNTRYFDTADLRLYHAHHAGRTPRVKVRVRTYMDSHTGFLEVKLKNNKQRTLKARVPVDRDSQNPLDRLKRQGFFGLALASGELHESVVVEYTRLTLVRKDEPERLTLDLMLTFTRDGQVRSYPGVVIAEVKQERRGPSYFHEEMRRLGLREGALSKYCLGIASLAQGAKKNRFKGILRRLERIGDDRPVPAFP